MFAEFHTILAASEPSVLQNLANNFGVELTGFLAQLILFIIIYFILQKFAFKPIMQVLQERREKIQHAEVTAKEIEEKLQNTETKIQTMLTEASKKSEKIIENAKLSAESVGEQKKQDAIEEAQHIIEKAKQATQAEKEKIITELRSEFGNLIIAASEKVTGKIINEDDQKRINKESVAQFNL